VANNFQQSIDETRPHTCLTVDPKHSGSLAYRYDDTQEVVTVPNIWYNQTYQERVAAVRWQAQLKKEAADKFQKYPTLGLSEIAVANIVARYRAEATRILGEAARMEKAGVPAYPVAAARIQLNFSEAVSS
jgi:hypothetical protein